jgi:DNA-nicking Smr family endonuclease
MAIVCPECKRQYDITLFQFGKGIKCDCGCVINPSKSSPLEIPIVGTLDLHTFKPSEVKNLIPEYLAVCREKGIFKVRIIHGKGTGALQRTVHSVLSKMPQVASFHLAEQEQGSWGATIVYLKPIKRLT